MQTAYYVVLVPMVYVAFAVFLVGTVYQLARILRGPKHPTPLTIFPVRRPRWLWALHDAFLMPSIRKHNPLHWIMLMLFHIAFLLLIIGHVELISEFAVLQIVAHEVFLGKGLIGLILTIALVYFLLRRFGSPYRDLSVPEDYYLLILLFLIVLFGSEMDWARSWYDYSEMEVEDYREYLSGLVYFKPELPENVLFSGHSFMLVLHVFFANIFIMLFPFSKIMHSFFSIPLNKLRRG